MRNTGQIYMEILPKQTKKPSLAREIAQHYRKRLHLGPAVIICDDPDAVALSLQGQWQKLLHVLQAERIKTNDSDKLFRLTKIIVEMQQAKITAQPHSASEATIICVSNLRFDLNLVRNCFSIYVCADIHNTVCSQIITLAPTNSLITVFQPHHTDWQRLGLAPKILLEKHVRQTWREVVSFLRHHDINIAKISKPQINRPTLLKESMDTLLEPTVASSFLQVAGWYKEFARLAEPLNCTAEERRQFETLSVLAQQVQTLSPNLNHGSFRTAFDDPLFFLSDSRKTVPAPAWKSIFKCIPRQQALLSQ